MLIGISKEMSMSMVQVKQVAREADLVAGERALEAEKAAVEAEREALQQQMAKLDEERSSNVSEVRMHAIFRSALCGLWLSDI